MMCTSLPAAVLTRNELFLIDTSYTMAYVRNALIPLVESVKDNPAIIGWEVFNEPEGFSREFGWDPKSWAQVPIADIQRVINLIAGAIHRTDPGALVTSGANSIQTFSDVHVISKAQAEEKISSLTTAQKDSLTKIFNSLLVCRIRTFTRSFIIAAMPVQCLGSGGAIPRRTTMLKMGIIPGLCSLYCICIIIILKISWSFSRAAEYFHLM